MCPLLLCIDTARCTGGTRRKGTESTVRWMGGFSYTFDTTVPLWLGSKQNSKCKYSGPACQLLWAFNLNLDIADWDSEDRNHILIHTYLQEIRRSWKYAYAWIHLYALSVLLPEWSDPCDWLALITLEIFAQSCLRTSIRCNTPQNRRRT